MTAHRKNDCHCEIELEEQHKAIVTYLRDKFGQFIEGQSQDCDPKGNRLPFFKERAKKSLIKFFEVICDSFGRSYKELNYDKKLGNPAETSRNVKRLNLFLREFSLDSNIDPDHPLQLFSYHKGSDKVYQVNFHFACARIEPASKHRTYSTDNIKLSEALERGQKKKQEEARKTETPKPAKPFRIVKLLHAVPPDPNFVGRRRDIKFLNDAWDSDKIHLASVIAWGGFGKSVFVRQWLEELNLSQSDTHKPQKILWWSFYQNDSVDAFLDAAITCLTPEPKKLRGSYHVEEGFDILLFLLSESPSILVLDGFEDMQYSQAGDYFGKCKSYQLKNFIRRICEGDCPECLCVITSRLPITDIVTFENKSHVSVNLENSPFQAAEARSLLRKHGVKGNDKLLDEIVKDHGGHPLALVTVATLLSHFFRGDARKASGMPSVAIPKTVIGDRFKLWSTFSWYDSLLNDAERHVLRAVSLFRQIAPWKLLVSFVEASKAIKTRGLPQRVLETKLRAVTLHLNQLQLIRFDTDADAYSMHPLVKTFFESSIGDAVAKDYHKLLFEILQAAAPQQPDTLNQMWPLIEAVYHGCKCGCIKESLAVFREKIDRKVGYLTKNLGAWETKIDLCSMFFSDRHFSRRCLLDDLEKQGHLLNAAGFAYMNLGLPVKAVPLFDRSAEIYRSASLQGDEGQVQRNRADTFLRIGRLEDAVDAANKALELDLSSKSQQSSLAYLGYAYALLGSFDQAELAFKKAVSLFGQDWLPPIRGVLFVETFIMKGQHKDAVKRSRKMLKWTKTHKILFSEAECLRVLALALGEIANVSGNYQTAQKAIKLIKKAVNFASRAGVHYYIVRTILDSARIVLWLTIKKLNTLEMSDLEHIKKQIHEIIRISKESCYRLIEAEAFLAKTYVCLLTNDPVRAGKELARAAKLAHHLKYQWLENKCSELQKHI